MNEVSLRPEPHVVCVGEAFVDFVTPVDRLPHRGGAAWCEAPRRHGGGTAGNVASGLARLGVAVSFAGRVGGDADGAFLTQTFAADGVGLDGLITDAEARTGMVVAMIEPDGQWTFIVAALGSAHTRLQRQDLQWILRHPPPVLFVTGVALLEEPSRSAVLDLVRSLSRRTRVHFDSNIAQLGEVEASLDAMKEMAALSVVVYAGERELETLAVPRQSEQAFVVKRGADGATLLGPGNERARVEAWAVDVVDVIGAGDAFDAAFIAAELRGHAPRAALAIANAAAALSVTHPGGRSMPTWAEVLALVDGGTDR
jgi:2-dehydro-3-deoxygluconokinase